MSTVTAAVDDLVPVGSVAILDSPHVSEGPGRIAKAPVPSIYVDDRGDIHRLRVGGTRMNLLYSVKGVMRSGYLHPHAMYDTVISGRVEVWTLTATGTLKTIYDQFQHFVIDPYVPHILYFLEDSILAEWWPHRTDFQCWYYHPYRKIIDIQNSVVEKENNEKGGGSGSTGHHQRLVPQDEARMNAVSQRNSMERWSMILLTIFSAAAGVAVGMGIGLALGNNDSNIKLNPSPTGTSNRRI